MRIAVHTRLRAGCEARYDEAHAQLPPELLAEILAAGATDWTIWRSGRDLFQVVECADYGALLAALEPSPVNRAWQARMASLQEVSHDYSGGGVAAALPVVWQLPTPERR